jgi:hypothetical protein
MLLAGAIRVNAREILENRAYDRERAGVCPAARRSSARREADANVCGAAGPLTRLRNPKGEQ